MIWIIFYTNINNLLVLGGGIKATLDFYPAASVFQCTEAGSLIINSASHVFYYFHVSRLSDDSWTLFGQTAAEVFPFLSPCEGVNGFTFLSTESHVYPRMCSSNNPWSVTTVCLSAGAGRRVRRVTAHTQSSRVLSSAQSPLTPQWAPNSPTLHTDIWLIADT